MAHVSLDATAARPQGAWYRDVTRTQWNAFIGAYLGWVLDGFDFTILTFLLVDIQRSFTVDKALAGALGTITLIFRVAGGIGAGAAADRWGRKGPLMFSILWYSLFSFLGGFSTSYGMLFAIRALFGIGMGGVWAAGMPLTLEHWPAHLRGTASGMMQSGYSLGFLLSSLVFEFGYPLVNRTTDMGWRVMLWIGIVPAFLVLFIMKGVKESPVWLERQRHLKEHKQRDSLSLMRLFKPDLLMTTLHTSILMGAFIFMYHSISYWYPTLLTQMHRPTLPFLAALNIGAHRRRGGVRPDVGRAARPPRRRHDCHAHRHPRRCRSTCSPRAPRCSGLGALTMGFFGAGNFGHRARLSHRAVPDGRARGGRRVRVPRRRRPGIVDADARRDAAGHRVPAADRHGRVHRRFGRDGDPDAVARARNARTAVPRQRIGQVGQVGAARGVAWCT